MVAVRFLTCYHLELILQEADGRKSTGSYDPSVAVSRKAVFMSDQDFLTIAILLFAVLAALLIPPGPGTPLRDRVQNN